MFTFVYVNMRANQAIFFQFRCGGIKSLTIQAKKKGIACLNKKCVKLNVEIIDTKEEFLYKSEL